LIVDSFGGLPHREVLKGWLKAFSPFQGYRRMFQASFSGLDVAEDGVDNVDSFLDAAASLFFPTDTFVEAMDDLGVDVNVLWVHVDQEFVPEILETLSSECCSFPKRIRLLPSYGSMAHRPEETAARIEQDHKNHNLVGVCLLPILDHRFADDSAYEPVYEVCSNLDLTVWIHTVNTWSERHPSDFCHPSHADRVACRFPDLSIVLGHGGWPWVTEAIAIAWRHPHVYLEPSAFRWKNLALPGSGWEPLLCYGNTMLAHKVLFGSLWPLLGQPLSQVLEEARALPLKPKTMVRWLGENAREAYRL